MNNGYASSDVWYALGPPRGAHCLRMFCLPHAGGSSCVFRAWQPWLPDGVELVPLELPGRLGRLKEQPVSDLLALADSAAAAVLAHAGESFALFGHSMGALLAFEIARRLERSSGITPAYLFAAGARAPHCRGVVRPTSHLPTGDLLRELRDMDGTPPELLENPGFMEFFLPVLRADFRAMETYRYQPGPPLRCPIAALGGVTDPLVSRSDLYGWREHTTSSFEVSTLRGGHFFLTSAVGDVLRRVLGLLCSFHPPHATGIQALSPCRETSLEEKYHD